MKKNILILTLITLFIACHQSKSTLDSNANDTVKTLISTSAPLKQDNSFNGLIENLKQYKNFYSIGDTLSSSSNFWGSTNIIDTTYLINFNLIDTTFKSQFGFRQNQLDCYHARLIGQYRYMDFLLILTYSMRTSAGDGNPLLILSVFNDKGTLHDQIKFDLYYTHDPELRPDSRFSISKEFLITENQIEKEFKLVGDNYVLNRTKSDVKKFKIDNEGHFYRL